MTPAQKVMDVLLHLIMLIMVIYCLIPLIWLVFSSTKTNEGLYSSPGLWFSDQNAFFQNIHDVFVFQDGTY
ncbi:MAG: carbohydrate ABC transporter permease, partial [Bifidobacterium sp.]|nr:carbohydrate ABC transporter permease [Bifidobacterium sp.]